MEHWPDLKAASDSVHAHGQSDGRYFALEITLSHIAASWTRTCATASLSPLTSVVCCSSVRSHSFLACAHAHIHPSSHNKIMDSRQQARTPSTTSRIFDDCFTAVEQHRLRRLKDTLTHALAVPLTQRHQTCIQVRRISSLSPAKSLTLRCNSAFSCHAQPAVSLSS